MRDRLDRARRAFADAAGFEPKAGRHLLLPGADGATARRAVRPRSRRTIRTRICSGRARLPGLLPAGAYRFANAPHDPRLAALAFALGAYRFTRYRKPDEKDVRLELPDDVDGADLTRIVEGVYARARSHQHAGERHGPGRARRRRARAGRPATAPRFSAIVGDDLLNAESSR